jgi:hypothetical protein
MAKPWRCSGRSKHYTDAAGDHAVHAARRIAIAKDGFAAFDVHLARNGEHSAAEVGGLRGQPATSGEDSFE